MEKETPQRELLQNEYFSLIADERVAIITVNAEGFPLKDFDQILKKLPMIKVNKFMRLKHALEEATSEPIEIGEVRPMIEVILSKDLLKASVRLNMLQEETESYDQKYIVTKIIQSLEEFGVKEGILPEVLKSKFPLNEEVVVARGIEPIKGTDANIRYIETSEKKPQITEDGKANFYEMNLIDEVQKGDWLGEKILATEGSPGRTVTGELLPPKKGKEAMLKYDPKTVMKVEEDGKISLYAKQTGAVIHEDGKIKVENILVINGDVGYKTGNIEFDGSVKIIGNVCDSFSIIATKDISILSPIGIGAIDKIISKQGDIYIQGGIFGKEKAYIEAGRNVYAKHANDCKIVAGKEIHLGIYSIGSDLKAEKIILDKQRGNIIGGNVEAKVQVVSAYIGNKFERLTHIKVQGFNRKEMKKELKELLTDYKKVLVELEKVKREIEIYEIYFDMNKDDEQVSALKEYQFYIEKQDQLVHEVFVLEERRKSIMSFLETKGEGEVQAYNKAYPKTFLEINNIQKRLMKATTGLYYVKEGNLFFE